MAFLWCDQGGRVRRWKREEKLSIWCPGSAIEEEERVGKGTKRTY